MDTNISNIKHLKIESASTNELKVKFHYDFDKLMYFVYNYDMITQTGENPTVSSAFTTPAYILFGNINMVDTILKNWVLYWLIMLKNEILQKVKENRKQHKG